MLLLVAATAMYTIALHNARATNMQVKGHSSEKRSIIMGVAKASFCHEDLENTLKQEATSSDEELEELL